MTNKEWLIGHGIDPHDISCRRLTEAQWYQAKYAIYLKGRQIGTIYDFGSDDTVRGKWLMRTVKVGENDLYTANLQRK